jgi:hypothetical protein
MDSTDNRGAVALVTSSEHGFTDINVLGGEKKREKNKKEHSTDTWLGK